MARSKYSYNERKPNALSVLLSHDWSELCYARNPLQYYSSPYEVPYLTLGGTISHTCLCHDIVYVTTHATVKHCKTIGCRLLIGLCFVKNPLQYNFAMPEHFFCLGKQQASSTFWPRTQPLATASCTPFFSIYIYPNDSLHACIHTYHVDRWDLYVISCM